MPPEDGEDRDIALHADGIVARLAGNHQAAIDIENGLEFSLLEGNDRIRRRFPVERFRHVDVSFVTVASRVQSPWQLTQN